MREGWTSGTKLLAAASLAGVVGFLFVMDVGPREARLVTKALPMVCLLLWLWPVRARHARFIFAGLALSLLGDVLLEMSPDLFLPGLGAFLLAHVGYIAAFLSVTRRLDLPRALPFALLAAGATVGLWPGLGGMAPPVTAYVAVICTMGWRAAALMGSPALTRREQWLAFGGALLFSASDGLLSIRLFVAPLPGLGYAVMLLYWAAQFCIAASARAAPDQAPVPVSSSRPI
ncbi:lysoplasmalogenase [Corallococcus carmarthensis]|uniref:Lysoplasmalogenase n=1 Tax=Corallococcus carmarthensis TaxID=2316728 RepID=A0A3A8JXT9_9BACT|nr:lysoplasmalogenase [Corallococcus carmarthensis]NOK19269.1 lysoplasmalogenase [Corallococcus carmarthensis]RKH00733.1 lysoplasmalogenase [Corallococcus carmarthensis]